MGLLDGKRAVVTGVANDRSIAWGIARALDGAGAKVAYTSVPGALRRVKKLTAAMDTGPIVACDVRSDEDIEKAFSEIGDAFDGKLDILVHCLAYADLDDMGDEFLKVSRSGWNTAMEISAYSFVAMARCARPLMKAAGGGAMMTLSFIGGERVTPGYNVMGIAKAALEASTRYLAYDLGPDNIRVNTIRSGAVRTMSSMVVENFDDGMKKAREQSPMVRDVTSEDVGGLAVFLGSDLCPTLTGAILPVDAGMESVSAPSLVHPYVLKSK